MTTKTSYFMGPLSALVAAMGALLIAYSASPARAEVVCSTTAGTTTCPYASTGLEDTFVVPDGVSTIHVVAIGAPGAVGNGGSSAGRGAEVSGDLTVTPGQTLYVNVGGAPTEGIGGFNGGGSSFLGGGGGGASDVREISRAEDGSLDSRLIVAGGGGGSGVSFACSGSGAGGAAGSDGGAGMPCMTVPGGTGGKAGTETDGGLGGSPDGGNGSLGLGGGGGRGDGGGGGGGYYGGGGGGAVNVFEVGEDLELAAPAGGGGGGSNLVPAINGRFVGITSDSPSITISYTDQADTTPPTVTDTSPDGTVSRTAATVTASFDEKVQNVTSSTFILERQIAVKKSPPKYVLVDATVTLDEVNGIYVLAPVEDLPKGNYRATITTDVADEADNALKQPEVWTFTVAK